LALILNFLGPLLLPAAPVALSRSGPTAVICTAQGFRLVALDADGQPLPPTHGPDIQCLFCLPLLKQGAAAPVDAPAVSTAAEPLAIEPPVTEVLPPRLRLSLAAAPRAPPFA
jgi:hypothetical protein